MATLKHGFFFFFLSKLFAVNCSTTNPTSPVHYGEPVNNGMFNSWAGQQPVTQGMTNNYNAYSSNPQGLQPNGANPNYQQQMNYGQQLTTPREPQSYTFQEQQYSQNSPQIAQSNPAIQNQFEKPQSPQSNPNSAYVQYQPTNTLYPNHNYVNTGYNQPNYQEKQSASSLLNTQPTKPQSQNVQPQPYQFSTVSQNGQGVPQPISIPISSSPNEYQNQFSSKPNQQPPQPPSPTFQPALSEAKPANPSLSNINLQSFPMSSALKPQQYQSNSLEKNPQQQLQSNKSPTPLQFKKPVEPPKSNTQIQPQFSQSNSSPSESQSSSLPVSPLSQQLTEKTKPIMQNTSQPPQPTKSSPSSQLKTSEVKPEIFSQFPQSNPASNQSKLPSLPVSSSLQPSQLNPSSIPNSPPQPINIFPPIQFKTVQGQSDSNTSSQMVPQSPQSNFFSNQSKQPPIPMSSSLQSSQSNSSSIMQNPPKLPLPTKSSPSLVPISKVQSESKTPTQNNIQSSKVNTSSYQSQPQSFPVSSSLQPPPLQSIPTGQNSPQPTKSSTSLQPPKDNSLTNQFQTQSIPVSLPLQQSKIQPKPLVQNKPLSPQPSKFFPPMKSNVPDELPGSNNNSPTQSNSPMTLTTPNTNNLNNLEPFQTLPQSSLVDLSHYGVQDQDFMILNSPSNLPDEFNSDIMPSFNDSNNSSPSIPEDNINVNDNNILGSQNELNNDQSPDFEDDGSNLESKLEKGASKYPMEFFETPTDAYDINNAIHSLEILKSDDPKVLTGLAVYDRPNNIDIEDPKNAEEENVKFRIFADPNDIHVINSSPTQMSPSITDKGNLNNINLFNTQPTRTSWSFPQWSNNAGVQQSNFNSDQLLKSLFNSNKNEIPTDMPNNSYDNKLNAYYSKYPDHKFSNMPQDISKNANQPNSMEDSGHIYKEVDLISPPSSVSSWSLSKQDYSKNKRPNQNYGYSRNNGNSQTSVFESPSAYNQINNNSIQNLISAISTAIGAPLDGTKAIFYLTQASFPNAEVIQQLNLTYCVVQSIILSLRKILNTVVNHLFGQRVKRGFNMFGPMSNITPQTTTEPIPNFPAIASMKKKEYQSNSDPNTNSYYNQPTTAPSINMNTYRQPTGISSNKPYSQQFFSSRPYVDTKKQRQQMYDSEINGSDVDYDEYNQDSMRAAQQAPNTRGYVSDMLTNEIRTQIYSNLPDTYTSNSPEVEEYCRQVMMAVEMFFRNQINNVLQGNSPTMNMV